MLNSNWRSMYGWRFVVVAISLVIPSIWASEPDGNELNIRRIVKTVRPNGYGEVRSPLYPSCCGSDDREVNILISVNTTGYKGPASWHIRVVFDDLDLPPRRTILLLYDGDNVTSVPFNDQPRYQGERGGWTRPTYTSSGGNFFIRYKPGPTGKKKYVGFKATYWTENTKEWKLDKPFTDCPVVGDAMDGGKISLTTISLPFERVHYRYDCIWQLKPPGIPDVEVFVRTEEMDLTDGKAVIRSGIYSEASKLKTFIETKEGRDKHQTFSSKEGLYIRVKKPIDEGYFTFVYGVFKRAEESEGCMFLYGSPPLLVDGFRCATGSMCIPFEHRCNKLDNCPDGSDEEEELCKIRTTTPLMVTSTLAPVCAKTCKDGTCATHKFVGGEEKTLKVCAEDKACKSWEKRCDDGKCVDRYGGKCANDCAWNERKCPKGECINKYYDVCPGECRSSQKKCRSGNCISSYDRCPEDPCPTYKDNKCHDGTCYYDHDICDGTNDCYDGSDEEDCASSNGGSSFNYRALLAILAVPFVVFIILCKMAAKARAGENREQNGTSLPTVPSEPTRSVGVRPPRTMTVDEPLMMEHRQEESRHSHGPPSYGITAPSAPATQDTAPPPSYDEVVSSNLYKPVDPSAPPPLQDPPSYGSVSHIPPSSDA